MKGSLSYIDILKKFLKLCLSKHKDKKWLWDYWICKVLQIIKNKKKSPKEEQKGKNSMIFSSHETDLKVFVLVVYIPQMPLKVGWDGERSLTKVTRVWLFSCVGSDVSCEICRAWKWFPTKSALVSSKRRGGREGGGESCLVQREGREPGRAGEW